MVAPWSFVNRAIGCFTAPRTGRPAAGRRRPSRLEEVADLAGPGLASAASRRIRAGRASRRSRRSCPCPGRWHPARPAYPRRSCGRRPGRRRSSSAWFPRSAIPMSAPSLIDSHRSRCSLSARRPSASRPAAPDQAEAQQRPGAQRQRRPRRASSRAPTCRAARTRVSGRSPSAPCGPSCRAIWRTCARCSAPRSVGRRSARGN